MSDERLAAGDRAPDAVVLDLAGQEVHLDSLWLQGPLMLNFVRHFGWMFCREWLAQLELHNPEIESAGLKVVSVGIGEVADAVDTCGRLAPSIACFTQTRLVAHEAYRLKMSTLASLPGTLAAVPRALVRGHIQGRATTDTRGTRMLGGVFVIDRAGIIRYAAYNEHAGDHPPIADVLAAAQNL